MSHDIVYLNGEYCPLNEAKISVMDRGFLFGDAVYEVIPVYKGRLFRMESHLARLEASLDAIRLALPLSRLGWRGIFTQLIQQNSMQQDAMIYLQVSRGPKPTRNHLIPTDPEPTVFVKISPHTPPTLEQLKQGIKAISLPDSRWEKCFIKSVNLLGNILAMQDAIDHGAEESIFIRDGFALEATISNLFIVLNDEIITPPLQIGMLGGITREVIIEIIHSLDIPFKEQNIPEADLSKAQEIWLTSSGREIRPVVALNGKSVARGTPGPLWERVIEQFQQVKLSG
jgi:D-alanine transaminase